MKKILYVLGILCGLGLLAAATTDPFTPLGKEYVFPATTSSGTAIQLLGSQSSTSRQYRIFVSDCSSATATVTTTFQSTQSAAATVVAPVPGVPQFTRTYPCGVPIEVLGAPPQAWFNAIMSAGTGKVWLIPGEGV